MLNKCKGTWEPKRPNEVDYRGTNWADDLDEGETITSFSFLLINTQSHLVFDNHLSDGKRIVSTLSGGKTGTEAVIVNQIKTSKQRTLETEISMRIQ